MENKFTPSVNIIRDLDKSFNYIHTPNAERVLEQLDNGFSAGIHSFNIIGSFGTGKSSFLLAFEKQLKGEKKFFTLSPSALNGSRPFKFINITGSYQSVEEAFSKVLGSASTDNALVKLENLYKKIRLDGQRLAIIIDEFGKFLEYAAANNPDKELYFIQQLAELANDFDKEILFITTLHQNFQAYTSELTIKQRMEWEKVKGRFKEIVFNEPVEQLLLLAAKYLSNEPLIKIPANNEKLVETIVMSKSFPMSSQLTGDLVQNLLPLDVLAAAVLTLSLQKYGQNERSLFSFLTSTDINGLYDYDSKNNPYYNLDCVYNYLIQNFYSFLSTKYNPDYSQWSAIRRSLERAEAIFERDYNAAAKLIKTIGLLNIFASKASKIDRDFLLNYATLALGIKEPAKFIDILKARKIIRYLEFKHWFILFDGTDLDIDLAVREAASHVDLPADIVPVLKEYFQFPYVLAKSVFFKTGTPRFFEIVFSDQPVKYSPVGEIDGYINIIFNDSIKSADIRKITKKSGEAILYGLYHKPLEIRNIIWEIKKVNHVLDEYPDDLVAQKDLKLFLSHLTNELNNNILSSIYTSRGNVTWYFNGEEKTLETRRDFNRFLSNICEKVYPHTPFYRNELVNRHNLSTNIPMAKRNFLIQLTQNWQSKDIGFDPGSFPPEKTIYLSLLKSTGIHREDEDGFMMLAEPIEESFKPLWKRCEDFLESTKQNKKSIADFVEILSARPFKIKQGFIEFWIPVFLFIKRDSFALFNQDAYVPETNSDILFLILKDPAKYSIKAFAIEGIRLDLFNKYRILINKSKENKLTNAGFVDTIRPYLTFYSKLPRYTKKTGRMTETALALRDAVALAKDPEKTFFEDIPNALGYTLTSLTESTETLEEFIAKLKSGFQQIQVCFEELIGRIETYFKKELGVESIEFPGYRAVIVARYKTLKTFLLLPHQAQFYHRLTSGQDDRKSWLLSLIQGVMNKSAVDLEDHEEEIVCKKLNHILFELDNLCEFSDMNVDRRREDIFKVEVTTLSEGTKANLLRFSRDKDEESQKLKTRIKEILSADKSINIAAMLGIIREQFDNE
ncbi:MAG: hypothetical protein QG657_2605 [Acidobacteriota bacterium]|nr:hypothetical protein [Acidobacteriota bacterium]